MKTYHVFCTPEGDEITYLGEVNSLREARRLAGRHAKGEVHGLEISLYGTAKAAGHCAGISAAPNVQEPAEWFGRGGWYCACLEAKGNQ